VEGDVVDAGAAFVGALDGLGTEGVVREGGRDGVGTPDLDTFEAFVTAGLGAVPGIAKIDSHLTMRVVKSPDRPTASAARRSVRRAR
jgi:hypothetical protein